MRYKQGLSSALMLGLCISSTAFAANVTIKGTIPGEVSIHKTNIYGLTSAPSVKQIVFQRVILSPAAQQYLATHIDSQLKVAGLKAKRVQSLPSAALVGMNGVPVLDQGRHGTCVTFAVTGAIDAVADEAKEGTSYDRYSELCSLELGTTLEKQSIDPATGEPTYPSGWDGSWGTIVLDQISKHGLITKAYQETKGCAGVREYPLMVEEDHGRAMTEANFDANSDKIIPPITYKTIMHSDDAFSDRVNTDEVLTKVKTALAAKHRVTFGTLLDIHQFDFTNGAAGTYKVPNDTWVLTKEIAKHAKNPETIEAGHEMIIVGYDDNAEVKCPDKDVHKGVLTLRNSWGKEAGDNGNYYMTYDHFKALLLEAAEYIPTPAQK